MLDHDRRYVVVPENTLFTSGGSTRPVFAAACGEEGMRRAAVPQGVNFTSGGSTRPVRAMAGCTDGQGLDDWRVVAVSQNVIFTSGGSTRPVFAFACCPAEASSSSSHSSSSSSSGSSSGSSSSSNSSSNSGSNSSSSSGGVTVPCCLNPLNATLYLTISGYVPTGGSPPCVRDYNGTYPIVFSPQPSNSWIYSDSSLGITFACGFSSGGCQGFALGITMFDPSNPSVNCQYHVDFFSVWDSCDCNLPYWEKDNFAPQAGCVCFPGTPNITVTITD